MKTENRPADHQEWQPALGQPQRLEVESHAHARKSHFKAYAKSRWRLDYARQSQGRSRYIATTPHLGRYSFRYM